jgi:hypothetical protein
MKHFWKDETGAVTVDWVVLTSATAFLAMGMIPPIRTAMYDMAVYIGETVAAYHLLMEE